MTRPPRTMPLLYLVVTVCAVLCGCIAVMQHLP